MTAHVMQKRESQETPDVATSPAKRTGHRWLQTSLLQLGFVVVFLGAWQLFGDLHVVNEIWISAPWPVAKSLGSELTDPAVHTAFYYTMYETLAGFAISAVTGVASGLILFEVHILERAARPFITLLNNLPRIVFAPLMVLYFGIGPYGRIALVVSVVYVMILLNTMAGLKSADPDHLVLARAIGAGRLKTFTTFMLPAALPTIFAALQLGLTFSLLTAVVGELLTGGDGFGALVSQYMAVYATNKVFALVFIMAVLATALSVGIRAIERRLLSWRKYQYKSEHER